MKRTLFILPVTGLLALACGSDGSDGQSYLVDVANEPAGANCPGGGSAISTGPDENGNGTLDADEVEETAYVCGDASSTSNQIVDISAEAAGSNCAAGGVAIAVGVDANGNGTLESDEVTSTTYVCDAEGGNVADAFGGVLPGNVTVNNYFDFSVLTQFTAVDGNLTIQSGAISGADSILLGKLQTVGGNFTLNDAGDATTLDLSALATVAGDFSINNATSLTSVDVSSLTSVEDNLEIVDSGNALALTFPVLTTVTNGDFLIDGSNLGNVSAPMLTTIGGDLVVDGAATTGDLGFAALTTSAEVRIDNGSTVGAVSLGALTSTGFIIFTDSAIASVDFATLGTVDTDLRIENTTVLSTLSFPLLTSVGTADFQVISNGALTSLSAPMLVSVGNGNVNDDFAINGNNLLATISFTALTTVTGAFEINNSILPCAQVDPVLAGLTSSPSSVDVSSNAADCTP